MDSVWSGAVRLPQFETLQGSRKTDVLIVGGGMAGILCAYFLQEKGVDYALVEGRRICSGVTQNTTAKITSQHGLIYRKLLENDGVDLLLLGSTDCMTLDHIPYIGAYAKGMPDCFVATGFCKWGMTSTMVAAMMLSEIVMDKQPSCQEVFCPSRNMLKPQLIVNGFEYLANLLTFSKKRCPHLGCALKWNEQEHSWDCSCHGSRFDENGILLDNPANGDKSFLGS